MEKIYIKTIVNKEFNWNERNIISSLIYVFIICVSWHKKIYYFWLIGKSEKITKGKNLWDKYDRVQTSNLGVAKNDRVFELVSQVKIIPILHAGLWFEDTIQCDSRIFCCICYYILIQYHNNSNNNVTYKYHK